MLRKVVPGYHLSATVPARRSCGGYCRRSRWRRRTKDDERHGRKGALARDEHHRRGTRSFANRRRVGISLPAGLSLVALAAVRARWKASPSAWEASEGPFRGEPSDQTKMALEPSSLTPVVWTLQNTQLRYGTGALCDYAQVSLSDARRSAIATSSHLRSARGRTAIQNPGGKRSCYLLGLDVTTEKPSALFPIRGHSRRAPEVTISAGGTTLQ